jgi:hypothetical protein
MQTEQQTDAAQAPQKPENKTLHARVEEYLALIVEADGEFTEEVELALGSIEEKAESYKRVRAMLDGRAEWYKKEAAKYARWGKSIEAHSEKLRQTLADEMDHAGLPKIQTRVGAVYFKNSLKIEILEEAKWCEDAPDEYVKCTYSPKKELLLAKYRDALKKHQELKAEGNAHELALAELPKGANVVISRSLVL